MSEKAQHGYKERIARHIAKLCHVLYPESQPAGEWVAPLGMGHWCNYLTFDIMSDIVFSAYYNFLGSDRFRYIPDMICKSNARMSVLVIIPWLTRFKFDHYFFKDAIIARFRFLKFVVRCVRERVERGKLKAKGMGISEDSISGGAGGDVFEALDTAKDFKTREGLKPEELGSESITLIVAGSETSSTAIASVLFYIADNRAVYDRVASEVRACPGEDSLAYHEIVATIGTILRRGDFRFQDGELYKVGRSEPGAPNGRHREHEYQLREHIAGQKTGPWLQFAPRAVEA